MTWSIRVAGQDLVGMHDAELRKLRASTVSMVYQNPGSALNPSIHIGKQVVEVFRIAGLGKDEAHDQALAMLKPFGSVTVSQLTSANLTDTNENSAVVNTTSTALTSFQPASAYSLPPFSMTVFTWQASQ